MAFGDGATHWVDEDVATAVFYGDCDISVARDAFQQLRPQSNFPLGIPCPSGDLPAVPSTCILCRDDAIMNPNRSRVVVHERLHAELIEMPGGHSPFLSRPRELAALLVG